MSAMQSASGGVSMAPGLLDIAYKKITWRLLPFLMFLWVLSWIDRVNIGFAKLQMLADLKFSETVYGIGAGIFFLGYFLCEVPSNLLLDRIGARTTIARITILWGICCIAMMFVTTPAIFYVLRFLLGVFEAGFYPGVILYLTFWYPTERRARAFGLFMSASAFAGVVGGPMAGTIMTTLNGVNGWSGWQWVFLIEGIPSVIAGVVTLLYLTDKPQKAFWLTTEERAAVQADLARDSEALGHREHRIMASLSDKRVWQCIAIFFCIVMANSALTFFGPTVVRDAGFTDSATIGWIMAVPYLCGGAGMILNGRHSDASGEARFHCGIAALVGAVGLVVLGFAVGRSPALSLIALTAAIVGTMSAIPVFWQIPGRFLAGSAAAAGIALINSVANLAGFGAPALMGALRDATGSVSLGLWIVAAFEGLTVLLLLRFIPSKKPYLRPCRPVQRSKRQSEEGRLKRPDLTRRDFVGAGVGGVVFMTATGSQMAQAQAQTQPGTLNVAPPSQAGVSPRLTMHAIDTFHGTPGASMTCDLSVLEGDRYRLLKTVTTAANGRSAEPLLVDDAYKTGRYELLMHFDDYFSKYETKLPTPTFLSKVPVRFVIRDTKQRVHLPVLFTPWGYSYYRGS